MKKLKSKVENIENFGGAWLKFDFMRNHLSLKRYEIIKIYLGIVNCKIHDFNDCSIHVQYMITVCKSLYR